MGHDTLLSTQDTTQKTIIFSLPWKPQISDNSMYCHCIISVLWKTVIDIMSFMYFSEASTLKILLEFLNTTNKNRSFSVAFLKVCQNLDTSEVYEQQVLKRIHTCLPAVHALMCR
jgi:hypothetical protein